MIILSAYIDTLTPEMIREGYARTGASRVCLVCGKTFEDGEVFPEGQRFFTAETAARRHMRQDHPDYLLALIHMDSNAAGLTEPQKELIRGMYKGWTDAQIAENSPGRGASAVRNMRFHLRKRAREAKVFLGIMGLLEDYTMESEHYISFEAQLPVHDDRTLVTQKEERVILGKYLKDDGMLVRFPKKEKEKLVVLNHIVRSFTKGTEYTEPEVNAILAGFLEDYVTLRRYLIEYRFLQRKTDGSRYWR
ncbi:MAG: DUF2087 domain-containing protein [Spirochaetales bacterium]|nr:DUF2087 domain-containing protein [Spirochaetales bacterium]